MTPCGFVSEWFMCFPGHSVPLVILRMPWLPQVPCLYTQCLLIVLSDPGECAGPLGVLGSLWCFWMDRSTFEHPCCSSVPTSVSVSASVILSAMWLYWVLGKWWWSCGCLLFTAGTPEKLWVVLNTQLVVLGSRHGPKSIWVVLIASESPEIQ